MCVCVVLVVVLRLLLLLLFMHGAKKNTGQGLVLGLANVFTDLWDFRISILLCVLWGLPVAGALICCVRERSHRFSLVNIYYIFLGRRRRRKRGQRNSLPSSRQGTHLIVVRARNGKFSMKGVTELSRSIKRKQSNEWLRPPQELKKKKK